MDDVVVVEEPDSLKNLLHNISDEFRILKLIHFAFKEFHQRFDLQFISRHVWILHKSYQVIEIAFALLNRQVDEIGILLLVEVSH